MLRDGKSRIRKTLLKNILIVKHGALGDVVRTSYFANSLKYEKKVKIYWLTSPHCLDLLNCNPNIDYIVTFRIELCLSNEFTVFYDNLTFLIIFLNNST